MQSIKVKLAIWIHSPKERAKLILLMSTVYHKRSQEQECKQSGFAVTMENQEN